MQIRRAISLPERTSSHRYRIVFFGTIFVWLSLFLPRSIWSAQAYQELLKSGAELSRHGSFEDAISVWTEALQSSQQSGDSGAATDALLTRARAYAAIGQHKAALNDLESARDRSQLFGDSVRLSLALAALGELHTQEAEPEKAKPYLQQALSLAAIHKNTAVSAVVYNSWGNYLAAQTSLAEALKAYRQSSEFAENSGNPVLAGTSLVNAAHAAQKNGDFNSARTYVDRAHEQMKKAVPSHDKVYGLISIGLNYQALRPHLRPLDGALLKQAAETLTSAALLADELNDRRGSSYGWGYLGGLYESEGRYQDALELTQRAVSAAQQVYAPESLYKWQWQTGRILTELRRNGEALSSYRRAITTLHSIRPELLASFSHPGASFRETLGPLYFQLVDLLLKSANGTPETQAASAALLEAREVIESFKVAELRDYFRDDCVDTALSKLTSLDVISKNAAIIYPILLADRIELLVTLPTGIKRRSVPIGSARITEEVRQFRRRLEKRTTREYLPHAQRLYDWLIRPVESEFKDLTIETLVLVPDGPLRTVPIAALHDGKQFLIAKYALATTPGLSLTDPHPINREATKVLAVGITESVQGFPPLPYVSQELEAIKELFGTDVLINEEFRAASLEEKLKREKVTILHMASHGEFSRDASQTFLLAFKDKITIDRLDQLIGVFRFRDEPLELLTLSACDTAAGDDRAALGLAGVAIKAGARSAVATLWNVNDEASADLVAAFYREIRAPSISRAVALQRAQLKIISDPRYDHPGFWSAFILINNWL